MTNPLRQLESILAGATAVPRFAANSRYNDIAIATLDRGHDRPIPYLRRRFVPAPDRFASLREHVVVQGDRLDLLSAAHFGDPELFWRLCDVNLAVRPDALTDIVGRSLRVAFLEGAGGSGDV